jgi:hypothetical protein
MNKIVKYEKAHASLTGGLAKMAQRLKEFDIDAEGAEFAISRMASQCQKARDLAQDRRDRELAPYVPEVRTIRARWKPMIEGFDMIFKRTKALAQDILRKKRAETERLRKEARKKFLVLQEAAKKKNSTALAKKRIEDAAAELDAMPPEGSPLGVKTDETTLYARKVWKWETIDPKAVPNTYVQRYIDAKKVDLAVKNGKREIPGIKIWEDEEMVSTRRRA